jgi:hypothetical protein
LPNVLKLVNQIPLSQESKNWSGRSAVSSIGDYLSKLHQELLQPADHLLNNFSNFNKNGHIHALPNFVFVFETSNALAVYLELFQLIISTGFLILSKSTLSGFIIRTL